MQSLEIKAIRALRSKIFTNMAVLRSLCTHTRQALEAAGMEEAETLSDREIAQMVQQWLTLGDSAMRVEQADATPEDVDASFSVLEQACERLLGDDFTDEERQALTSLGHYIKRRIGYRDEQQPANTAARQDLDSQTQYSPAPEQQQGFLKRFWVALNSA